ncbi:MAG: HEAT repeat domain-containing protein [Aphanocapsa lilacina HA4352-LM1]|jgi:bilin biosynthesis protein|nr:HEAT repeat domain-containing protein [Aphanocapsa lilacina HA4352-LM1]
MVDPQPSVPTAEATDRLLDAVNALLAIGTFDTSDTALLGKMVASLADGRGMVRLGLVEAFGKIGLPAVPMLLEGLSHHPNPVVRRSCGKALAKTSDPRAVPVLIEALLHDEDTVVRSSAAGALAKMGEAAVPQLIALLTSEHSETAKGHAAWALAFMGTEVAEHLYAAYTHPAAAVRTAVVAAVANLTQETTDERAVALLECALTDSAPGVRAEAAAALGTLAHQPAVPLLVEQLADPSPEVRKSAALALAKIGDPTSLGPLEAQLARESGELRRVVAVALAQLQKRAMA